MNFVIYFRNIISGYSNDAFTADTQSFGTVELNVEPLNTAARISTNVQDRRFRNFEAFQQFPPPRSANAQAVEAPNTGALFPIPDYSPVMSRHNTNNLENQNSRFN